MLKRYLYLINTVAVVLVTGSVPDIFLTGLHLKDNDTTLFHFVCASSVEFLGCTMEFLLDTQTFDDIRYVDNICYHTNGVCNPEICACAADCKSFRWNFTAYSNMKNHTFGCSARFKSESVIYKANISVTLDEEDFIIINKTIVPIGGQNTPEPPISATTTPKEITHTEPITLIIGITVPIVAVAVILIVILIVWYICCKKKEERQESYIYTIRQNESSV